MPLVLDLRGSDGEDFPSSRRGVRGMTERYNQPLGGNEMPRFGGPASMMRLPTPPSADGLDAFRARPIEIRRG